MVICDYYLRGICRFGNDCWNEHPTKKIDLNNNIDSINKESISKIKPIFSDDKLRVLKTDMKELKNDLRSLFRAFSFSNNSDQEQKNSKSPTIFGSKNNLQIPTSNIPSIKFTIGTSNKKPCEEGKEKHNNRSRYNIYFSREKLIPEVKKLPLSHIETESFEGNLFETNEIKEINMKELISAINKLQDVFNNA
ncbi:hypothetical protein PVAND_000226 [Polypedilum vanderplanki]|uniref:Nucleoporin NUP42 n=1 Tax=Polypedilum vanderplanki TaxID=319348 RepID=A0A9J6BJ68_POLVA|nr:hypothetical protein PVAND_000226 [Polypedilum vanderplanki]